MHMADALVSPLIGASLWTATAAAGAYSAKRAREEADPARVPLMGVAGAFVFAAQMVNFQIPGTGSSGHLGGGILLAVLLGPEAAFLTMASVLTVQALFFADGGLLALGANIFNLGFIPAFLVYPLVYRPIASRGGAGWSVAASLIAGTVTVPLGAMGVVLETVASGVTALPLAAFAALMVPIHLAIGLVEGVATATIVTFVRRAQPDMIGRTATSDRAGTGRALAALAIITVAVAGVVSGFAATDPDGLEWSISRVTGSEQVSGEDSGVHRLAEAVQERLALFPGYASNRGDHPSGATQKEKSGAAGLVGGALTLTVVAALGVLLAIRGRSRRRDRDT